MSISEMEQEEHIPIAIPFKRYHELEGKVKEYNINFRSEDSSLDNLIDFITLDFVKRVNICFSDNINIHIINTANKIKDCVYVRVKPEQYNQISKLQFEGIRYFLDSSMPAANHSQLAECFDIGVSDVYISDDLTYNMKEVRDLCHANNIQIRVVLNTIPMTTLHKGKDVKSMIYRPQDREMLEDYFDVFEFDCGEPYNWNIFNVLYKAFFINNNWYGNLAEINPEIKFPFRNEQIAFGLTSYKIQCGRVCDVRASNPCKKCQQFIDIANELYSKGVALK